MVAASALVIAIIGLGVIWSRTSLAGIVTDGHGDFGQRPPSGSLAPEDARPNAGDRGRHHGDRAGGSMMDRLTDVGQTTVTEGALVGGVIFVDRRRRMKRTNLRRPVL
jgi:hypothetical protein